MALKFTTEKVVSVQDWDKLVETTYGRPYRFQQQNGCQDRGTFLLAVPSEETNDFENPTVPEEVNHPDMGLALRAGWPATPSRS